MLVLEDLMLAREMRIPPTRMWGELTKVTYTYDAQGRVSGSIQAPEWTSLDVALLQGLQVFEDTLCPGCQHPKHLAWHKHTEEEWDPREFVCHACSAKQGHEVVYSSPRLGLTPEKVAQLPPYRFPEMTTRPTKKPTGG